MNFAERQEAIKAIKMSMVVRRAMTIQARSKIKPNTMRPSLQVMSILRGGDVPSYGPTLELLWPGQ